MQRKIAQVVDSAGSIPREVLEKYGIREVAFHINFNGQQQYQEHINITSQEFYERMQNQPNRIPKTSIPGVAEWAEAFEEKLRPGISGFDCYHHSQATLSQCSVSHYGCRGFY